MPVKTYHVTESTRALCIRPLLNTGLSSRLIPSLNAFLRITHIFTVLSICSGERPLIVIIRKEGEITYATSCDKRVLWVKGLENL